MPMSLLLIDDIRNPGPKLLEDFDTIEIARTSEEAMELLSHPDGWNTVMFDHDLGFNLETGDEDTIRRVITHMQNPETEYHIENAVAHSANPVGRKWVVDSLTDIKNKSWDNGVFGFSEGQRLGLIFNVIEVRAEDWLTA